MSAEFSSKLLLLRQNAGLSQKQAATDLGISQALLSHYEKGIRECSLDFVVRAAEYYGVSSDYMLGVGSAEKSGALSDDSPLPSDRHAEPLTVLRALVKLSNTAEITGDAQEEHFTDFFSVCIKKYLATLESDGKNTAELCNPVLSALSVNTDEEQTFAVEDELPECIASVLARADILIKQYLDTIA